MAVAIMEIKHYLQSLEAANLRSDFDALDGIVMRLVQKLTKLKTESRRWEDKKTPMLARDHVDLMILYGLKLQTTAIDKLSFFGAEYLQRKDLHLVKITGELELIAGGHPDGQAMHWTVGLSNPDDVKVVCAHAKDTLMKMNPGALVNLLTTVKTAFSFQHSRAVCVSFTPSLVWIVLCRPSLQTQVCCFASPLTSSSLDCAILHGKFMSGAIPSVG
jgi:hypothetical protein